MKKLFFAFVFSLCSFFCFSNNLDDEVLQALLFLIPENNTLIEVNTPYYDNTYAASEFSNYLKNSIETILTACGKEIFDYDFNDLIESKMAEYSDSGYFMNAINNISQRRIPDGPLISTFTERNNSVDVFFEYGTLEGKKKKTKFSISTKDIPGLSYQPDNLDFAKQICTDIQSSENIANKNLGNSNNKITITAAMLDSDNNMVNVLHPGDILTFLVNCDKDAYIAITGIDANGNQFWLLIEDNFMKENVPRRFPDGDVDYQVTDGIFGAELLYIYAATSKDGLPIITDENKYHPNIITNTTRGFIATKKKTNMAKGVFAIPYTVIAE